MDDFDFDSDGFITYRGVRVGMDMALDEGAIFLKYPEEVRVDHIEVVLGRSWVERREFLRGLIKLEVKKREITGAKVYGHFC